MYYELTEAHDAYTFLVEWFKRFPQFKGHDFYITGESYAGILARAPGARSSGLYLVSIACICFMIGNAAIDDASDDRGMVEYAWDHAVISDRVYGDVKAKCDFSKVNVTDACDAALQEYFAVYLLIDMYSLYTPVCTDPGSSASASSHRKVAVHGAAPRIFSKYVRAFEHPSLLCISVQG